MRALLVLVVLLAGCEKPTMTPEQRLEARVHMEKQSAKLEALEYIVSCNGGNRYFACLAMFNKRPRMASYVYYCDHTGCGGIEDDR